MLFSIFSRLLPILSIILVSCSNQSAIDVYQNSYEGGIAVLGKVVSVRKIAIESDKNNSGSAVAGGAAIGSIAGAGIGHSAESTILGAIIGGTVGYAASETAKNNSGSEYVIKIDTSNLNQDADTMRGAAFLNTVNAIKSTGLVVVVQKEDKSLLVGQDVYVLISGNGNMRVIPIK
ncbi:outer membrane lipoprotein [Candidatus Fokinia crypta]|uniref:Uncharacterized protein n=1 Tax=Candidatus Fokinia crypta TaxID=1920990 RepID=A0ABZ0UP58_9RICK|nr:hypothetical protein [Candidatus Fokinia cryptica]WPX97916.1 hypothetical protein Fokcrypt_00440 [Candidatus Fokinia cryptica]